MALVSGTSVIGRRKALMRRGPIPGTGTTQVVSVATGANEFMATVVLSQISRLETVSYTIAPKPGSVAPPLKVSYSYEYLHQRGLVDPLASTAHIPIIGLYASATRTMNHVRVTVRREARKPQTLALTIPTTPWQPTTLFDYSALVVNTPPSRSVPLGFGLFLLKPVYGPGPVIMDTDGEIRWVQPNALRGDESLFWNNRVYQTNGTQLYETTLDGVATLLNDFATLSVDGAFVSTLVHHNIDPSPQGLFLCAETAVELESLILEVDATGALKNSFNLYDIISQAMVKGGDDPSLFVLPSVDWFHNNANCYWAAENMLVVSSRENFVMGIRYDTKEIAWILGDTTKYWATFASLRALALQLTPGVLPGGSVAPQGQHAVSISSDGYLMMMDDGTPSFNGRNTNLPGPAQRAAVARKYAIDPTAKTVTEVWRYEANPAITSAFGSSIYQMGPSYLLNYSMPGVVLGIGDQGQTAVNYTLPGGINGCWNAQPLDWSNVTF